MSRRSLLERLPKVLLHDHLDGGLRPATIIELAGEAGYDGLPRREAAELAGWFDQTKSGSLETYLAAFAQTVAVLQTPGALQRAAFEAVEDWAATGVLYGEIRFAPSLHRSQGMTRIEVIESVLAGLAAGSAATGVGARLIVDAMRQADDSEDVARAAVACREGGVVGFDLAGPEAGFPASRHARALAIAAEGGLRLTIHAGEADGTASIADALDCGAERLGHGVRIADDLSPGEGDVEGMGPVATRVRDAGVPLEVCPTSNLHTGVAVSADAHPLGRLYRAGFAVTLNTDNRLMSATDMTREFRFALEHHGFTIADLESVTAVAADAAFCDDEARAELRTRIAAGYAAI
jgi:adenosine deaminase